MEVFQYISSLLNPVSLNKMLGQKYVKDTRIILDLEDAVMDTLVPSNTSSKKEIARDNLRQLTFDNKNIFIGIRINHIDTEEFQKDIQLLHCLKNISLKYIVLPKITNYSELKNTIELVKIIQFEEIICCIESENGIRNLHEILESYNYRYKLKIQFGHYDYFLDQQLFPIPNYESKIFWNVSKRIIEICNKYKYTFLQSPCNRLQETSYFEVAFEKLNYLCDEESGFATISFSQSKTLKNIINGNRNNSVKYILNPAINYDIISIINNYKKNQKGSFYLDISNDKFFAPHDYIAAKYLNDAWKVQQ